ncbi:MAG: anthranilate synthase component II [Verrucomicrobiota bacterium]
MILMIDNYDSFTYNLVQYIQMLKKEVKVYRNNALTVDEALAERPEAIIISPGPGTPDDAGISVDLIRRTSGTIPIFGICLGHQCIAAAFGAEIGKAEKLMHGKVSEIEHDGNGIFQGLKSPLSATRYHSLSIVPQSLPECLRVTARTTDADHEIMAVSHKEHPTVGVQFHPESILTVSGKRLLRNFFKMIEQEG